MKKVLSLMLAAVLMLCLCSCTVKLSTTTTVPSEDISENTVTPYEELSLEEKMEARSVVELIPANEYNADLLAPAMDSTTGLWGFISIQGEWKIAPSFKTALPFDGDYAKTLDEYQDIIFIDREGNVVVQFGPVTGKALWDTSGADGERVATGIYHIYAAQGEQPAITGTPRNTVMIIK